MSACRQIVNYNNYGDLTIDIFEVIQCFRAITCEMSHRSLSLFGIYCFVDSVGSRCKFNTINISLSLLSIKYNDKKNCDFNLSRFNEHFLSLSGCIALRLRRWLESELSSNYLRTKAINLEIQILFRIYINTYYIKYIILYLPMLMFAALILLHKRFMKTDFELFNSLFSITYFETHISHKSVVRT